MVSRFQILSSVQETAKHDTGPEPVQELGEVKEQCLLVKSLLSLAPSPKVRSGAFSKHVAAWFRIETYFLWVIFPYFPMVCMDYMD